MKGVIDAQLPRRLAHLLRTLGWDVVHTLDLPLGNLTSDAEITRLADFVHSQLLREKPQRLLLVAVGNVSNDALVRLFSRYATEIETLANEGNWLTLSPLGVEAGLPLL